MAEFNFSEKRDIEVVDFSTDVMAGDRDNRINRPVLTRDMYGTIINLYLTTT
jgi:hypothetical protein